MNLNSMLKICSIFCIIFGLPSLFSVAASNSELESLCSIRSDVTRCEFTVPKAPISNYMMTVYDGVNQEQVKKINLKFSTQASSYQNKLGRSQETIASQ